MAKHDFLVVQGLVLAVLVRAWGERKAATWSLSLRLILVPLVLVIAPDLEVVVVPIYGSSVVARGLVPRLEYVDIMVTTVTVILLIHHWV